MSNAHWYAGWNTHWNAGWNTCWNTHWYACWHTLLEHFLVCSRNGRTLKRWLVRNTRWYRTIIGTVVDTLVGTHACWNTRWKARWYASCHAHSLEYKLERSLVQNACWYAGWYTCSHARSLERSLVVSMAQSTLIHPHTLGIRTRRGQMFSCLLPQHSGNKKGSDAKNTTKEENFLLWNFLFLVYPQPLRILMISLVSADIGRSPPMT